MEGHYSTGQSPQWAVVPVEEEEEEEEEEEVCGWNVELLYVEPGGIVTTGTYKVKEDYVPLRQ